VQVKVLWLPFLTAAMARSLLWRMPFGARVQRWSAREPI